MLISQICPKLIAVPVPKYVYVWCRAGREWKVSVLGRQARELPSFSLAPQEPPSQGGGKLLDGCPCLRVGSRALEANIVNNIDFVFCAGTVCTYCTKLQAPCF